MSELNKNNVPQEINEDELDLVAGGVYTKAEWDAMSPAERNEAQVRSIMLVQQGNTLDCKLVN